MQFTTNGSPVTAASFSIPKVSAYQRFFQKFSRRSMCCVWNKGGEVENCGFSAMLAAASKLCSAHCSGNLSAVDCRLYNSVD